MRFLFFICILTLLAGCQSVDFKKDEAKGVQFLRGSMREAMQQAQSKNQLIFLDFYAEWCSYCKKMKQVTFSDPTCGEYLNSKFVNMTVDAEKGEGQTLAARFQIRSFPAYVILSPDGQLLAQGGGYKEVPEFITWLQTVLPKK
ncbi:MAG: thioredoxin family protein [Chitinophagaceae bacterium]|nr:thioredoxin family protein [Chitinophagaceae bacterium]